MSLDFRYFYKITDGEVEGIEGYSVYSNNHVNDLKQYHPPKREDKEYVSILTADENNSQIVRIIIPDDSSWNQANKEIMESLELEVSRLQDKNSNIVTEVSANRINKNVTGPYVLDSYHVKVDSFVGRKAYLERMGWIKLANTVAPVPSDLRGFTTGYFVGEDQVKKLYYFNLEKLIANQNSIILSELAANNFGMQDIFLIDEFFTTDWYWVNKQ